MIVSGSESLKSGRPLWQPVRAVLDRRVIVGEEEIDEESALGHDQHHHAPPAIGVASDAAYGKIEALRDVGHVGSPARCSSSRSGHSQTRRPTSVAAAHSREPPRLQKEADETDRHRERDDEGAGKSSGIFRMASGTASSAVVASASLPWSKTGPLRSSENRPPWGSLDSHSGWRLATLGMTGKL